MSKYFDKLLKMNESLDAELKKRGLEFVKENEDQEMVSVPADSLSDDQKKGILSDTLNDAGLKVDDKVVDELVKNPEQMAGVQKVLGDGQKENESTDDVSEEVVIRMDDDDLDIHGFVKKFENGELEWTNDEQEAERFQHEELGQNKIEAICTKFHYDPSTFTIKSVDPRADEPYEDDEEGQNWVSLDPMHPGATTLP